MAIATTQAVRVVVIGCKKAILLFTEPRSVLKRRGQPLTYYGIHEECYKLKLPQFHINLFLLLLLHSSATNKGIYS